jgi:hypothetical protein
MLIKWKGFEGSMGERRKVIKVQKDKEKQE